MTQPSATKIGVYVDAANLYRNGGHGMRYEVLRDFAARDSGELVRLNAYVTYDARRAAIDPVFKRGQDGFHSALRDFGYKVIVKQVKWLIDDSGQEYGKANADLDMAVDALLQSENLDRVLLATGDGDFVQVVRALQNRGCRVEVVAFDNVSADLRCEADMFVPGFLIPNLLPIEGNGMDRSWGQEGSRVRGTCYSFQQDKFFGFLRYLRHIGPGLWNTDTRRDGSPYMSAFAHGSEYHDFDVTQLPSRDHIFEFTLAPSDRGDGRMQARDVVLVQPNRGSARPTTARPARSNDSSPPLPGTSGSPLVAAQEMDAGEDFSAGV